MDKKVFNWLGLSIILTAFLISIITVIISIEIMLKTNNPLSGLIMGLGIVFMLISVARTSVWYDFGMKKLLPYKETFATVMNNDIAHYYRYNYKRHTIISQKTRYFLLFETNTGRNLLLSVPHEIYLSCRAGTSGYLTYQEQGKHKFFVSFKKSGN